MKKTSIIICVLCALTMVFAVGCGKSNTETAKTASRSKESSPKQQENVLLLGDANADGEVSIIDVTLIQRVLAKIDEDKDGRIAQRCDVDGNGLDILDVTMIQKYLAGFDNIYSIGTPIGVKATETVTEPVADTTAAVPPATAADVPANPEPTEALPTPTVAAETQSPPTTVPQPITENAPATEFKESTDFTLGENDLPFDDL